MLSYTSCSKKCSRGFDGPSGFLRFESSSDVMRGFLLLLLLLLFFSSGSRNFFLSLSASEKFWHFIKPRIPIPHHRSGDCYALTCKTKPLLFSARISPIPGNYHRLIWKVALQLGSIRVPCNSLATSTRLSVRQSVWAWMEKPNLPGAKTTISDSLCLSRSLSAWPGPARPCPASPWVE